MAIWLIVKRLILAGLVVFLAAAVIYFVFVRPWILRMGATDEEVGMAMPGDGLVTKPSMKYIQAITIDAPKELVWAYLIQVGYKRGGWYNWDFINGSLTKDYFYENGRSADRIIAELQDMKEGDKIYLAPPVGLDVAELKDYEHMLLTGAENGKYLVSWSYKLKELNKCKTRLYVRWNSDLPGGAALRLFNLIITEPGGVGIQQSQMLKGIKKRVEKEYENSVLKKPSD